MSLTMSVSELLPFLLWLPTTKDFRDFKDTKEPLRVHSRNGHVHRYTQRDAECVRHRPARRQRRQRVYSSADVYIFQAGKLCSIYAGRLYGGAVCGQERYAVPGAQVRLYICRQSCAIATSLEP